MFMRYKWGLGVGHTYAHKDATAANMKILHTGNASQATTAEPPDQGASSAKTGDDVSSNEYRGRGDSGEEGGCDEVEASSIESKSDESDSEEDSDDDDWRRNPEYDSEAEKEFLLYGQYDY